MKILWLSHLVPYPPKAGVLLRAYNLLRETSRYHEVDLFAFVQESWIRRFYPDLQDGIWETRERLSEFCTVSGYTAIPWERRIGGRLLLPAVSAFGGLCYTIRWLTSSQAREQLQRIGIEKEYDIVHFDTISLAQYRDCFGRTPCSLGHHNIESHMMLRRAELAGNPVKRLYFYQEGCRLKEYERKTASEFKVHITCSALDSERLREQIPEAEIVDVANGVDIDYFQTDSARSVVMNSLVFVGTMDWYPNVQAMEWFIEQVWPKLDTQRPRVTLGIVGSNPPESLRQLAARVEGITVYGYVDDVRPYIQGADLYVCPIFDGGGTKLKLLDAFAMKKCVVAHPVAVEGINVTEGVDVCLASTVDQYVKAIAELLDRPDERLRIGNAARTLAENEYSFSALGRKFSDVLESAAEQKMLKAS